MKYPMLLQVTLFTQAYTHYLRIMKIAKVIGTWEAGNMLADYGAKRNIQHVC